MVLSSATTTAEARWLEDHGVDAVIAQGYEAGGHRGMFLSENLAAQVGTFALVPQIADAVKVPVIATGAITDARGIVAAFALGAAGVQIGTAYLFCPESKMSAPHRAALKEARDDGTAVTNLMTGRPARGIVNRVMREIGPVSDLAPEFPLAAGALAPLRAKAEAQGSGDFTPMWAGQAAALGPRTAGRRADAQARGRGAGAAGGLGAALSVRQSQPRSIRTLVPHGSAVSTPFAVVVSGAPACTSLASTASNALTSAVSNANQASPARSSSRLPAPALCQTLPPT